MERDHHCKLIPENTQKKRARARAARTFTRNKEIAGNTVQKNAERKHLPQKTPSKVLCQLLLNNAFFK
jgi:hypothetical protein